MKGVGLRGSTSSLGLGGVKWGGGACWGGGVSCSGPTPFSSPDGLSLCHLPHGPTAHFTLSGAVLRQEVGGLGGAPLAAPHLLLLRLDSPLGRRVGDGGGTGGTGRAGGCGGTGETRSTGRDRALGGDWEQWGGNWERWGVRGAWENWQHWEALGDGVGGEVGTGEHLGGRFGGTSGTGGYWEDSGGTWGYLGSL